MYPSGASEPTAVNKEPLFVGEQWFFMNAFIPEALMEKNIASECICTAAAMYGCLGWLTCVRQPNPTEA